MLGALFYPKGTIENPIRFDELYIPHIYREVYIECVYSSVFVDKNETVIDIGANIGIVTAFMRDYAKKVYAIEPNIDSYEALKKNKEYNKWDNVEIFDYAIGDRDGEMMLNEYAGNRTMHSLTTDYHQGGKMVKTVSLDTFFKDNNIDEADFIKLDVEGGEQFILTSPGFLAVSNKIKAMAIEFHYPGWEGLVSHLESLGFKSQRQTSSAIMVIFKK
jgi:FkbM family methyltransferase